MRGGLNKLAAESAQIVGNFHILRNKYPTLAVREVLRMAYYNTEDVYDSKTFEGWVAGCIRKHVKGNEPPKMKREQCLAAAYDKFGISKDMVEDFIDNGIKFIQDYNLTNDTHDASLSQKEIDELKALIGEAGAKGAPALIDAVSGKSYRGKISFKNRPLSPVSSSMVMGRAVSGNKLYVRFLNKPNRTYKYQMNSNEEAVKAFEDMPKRSPGGFVWDELRGKKSGPVYGNPQKMTPGGTSASKVPYEPVSSARMERFIPKVPKFEEIAQALSAYKTAVKEPPTSREAYTIKELKKAEALGIHQPKIDMTTDSERLRELTKKVKEAWSNNTSCASCAYNHTTSSGINYCKKYGKEVPFRFKCKDHSSLDMTTDAVKEKEEGRWITIKGKHIFLKPGEVIKFGPKGEIKTVPKSQRVAEVSFEKAGKVMEKQREARKELKKRRQGEIKKPTQATLLKFSPSLNKQIKELKARIKKEFDPKAKKALEKQLVKLKEKQKAKPKSKPVPKPVQLVKRPKIQYGEKKGKTFEAEKPPEVIRKVRVQAAKRLKSKEKVLQAQCDRLPKTKARVKRKLDKIRAERDKEQEKFFRQLEGGGNRNALNRANEQVIRKDKEIRSLERVLREPHVDPFRTAVIGKIKDIKGKIKHLESSYNKKIDAANKEKIIRKNAYDDWVAKNPPFSAVTKGGKLSLAQAQVRAAREKKNAKMKKWYRESVTAVASLSREKNRKIKSEEFKIARLERIKEIREAGEKMEQGREAKKLKTMRRASRKKRLAENVKRITAVQIRERKEAKKDFIETMDILDELLYPDVNYTHDFIENEFDFSTLHGPIVRAGPYEYIKNGQKVILYKDYDNLKDVYGNLDYIPLKGTKKLGSHHADIIGFFHKFQPNDKDQKIYADIVTFDDIDKLSDLRDPDEGWQLSMGYEDEIIGNKQYVKRVDHGAISLNNLEVGRCSTAGGDACYAKKKEMINDMDDKKKPKKDGSGKGKRENKGRGGCPEDEQEKKGKGYNQNNDLVIGDERKAIISILKSKGLARLDEGFSTKIIDELLKEGIIEEIKMGYRPTGQYRLVKDMDETFKCAKCGKETPRSEAYELNNKFVCKKCFEESGKSWFKKDYNDQNLKEVDALALTKKESKRIKKEIGKKGDFFEVDDAIIFKADDGSIYTIDFDNQNENLTKNGEKKMPEKDKKKKKEDESEEDEKKMAEDAADVPGDDIKNNEEYASEIDTLINQGKTRTEAQEIVARQRKAGKHDLYTTGSQPDLKNPEFTDTGNITPDMIKGLVESVNVLKQENAKLKQDFAPFLDEQKKKLEQDFTDLKKDLIEKYEVNEDYVNTLDFENAKTALNVLEKSKLIKEALFYRDPMAVDPPSVLDMEDDEKDKSPDEWSFLKVS